MRQFIILLFLVLHAPCGAVADELVDSLKRRLAVERDPIEKCRILSELSDNAPEGEWQKYNEELGELTKVLIQNESNSDDSLVLYMRSVYFNNRSYDYLNQTNYASCISCLDSAYRILLFINNQKELILNRNNIGAIYDRIGDRGEAIRYYLEALDYKTNEGEKKYFLMVLNNLGKSYLSSGDTASAKKYLMQAIKIANEKQVRDRNFIYILWNTGNIYIAKGQLDSAFYYFDLGCAVGREISENAGLALCLSGLSEVYFKKNDLINAAKFSEEAYIFLESTRYYYELKAVSLIHSRVFRARREYEMAFKSLDSYIVAKDSLQSKDIVGSLVAYQIKTDSENKEIEAKREMEMLVRSKDLLKRKQYLGIFSFIIFLFTAFVVLRKSKFPLKLIDSVGFIGVLLFFQFIEVMINPYVDEYSYGNPVFFMSINIFLAAMIKPLHDFMERKVFQGKRRGRAK